MAYTKYSLTPANNNAAPPDGAPEGMLPSAVNDTMRDMMAQIRDCGDGIRGGTYTMTAPVITGGSISGASVSATSLTDSGNLTFTGTGNRILGDFSNATIANRVSFQNSVTNGNTNIQTLPNGTSLVSGLLAFNNTDPTNAGFGGFQAVGGEVRVTAGITGTGTYPYLSMYTSGTEKFRIAADTTGTYTFGGTAPRITGDFSNATLASRVMFQTSTVNGNTSIAAIPNGTSVVSNWLVYNNSDITNTGRAYFSINSATVDFVSEKVGTGTYLPITMLTGGSERLRIDTSGIVFIGTTSQPAGSPGRFVVQSSSSAGLYAIKCLGENQSGTYYYINFSTTGGTQTGFISSNGTTTTYSTSSDYRLKENIEPMQGALDVVQQLKPVTYNWKLDGSSGQGFIAHELQAVVPDCVTGEKDAMRTEKYEITPAIAAEVDEDGKTIKEAVEAVIGEREVPVYQGIDTSFLVATLTAAIQEQQVMINELKAKVAALEAA